MNNEWNNYHIKPQISSLKTILVTENFTINIHCMIPRILFTKIHSFIIFDVCDWKDKQLQTQNIKVYDDTLMHTLTRWRR